MELSDTGGVVRLFREVGHRPWIIDKIVKFEFWTLGVSKVTLGGERVSGSGQVVPAEVGREVIGDRVLEGRDEIEIPDQAVAPVTHGANTVGIGAAMNAASGLETEDVAVGRSGVIKKLGKRASVEIGGRDFAAGEFDQRGGDIDVLDQS